METKANMQTQRCTEISIQLRIDSERLIVQQRELHTNERAIRSQNNQLQNLDRQVRETGDPEGLAKQIQAVERRRSQLEAEKGRLLTEISRLNNNLRKLNAEFSSLRCGRDRRA
ncbi:MAG: hypothetical protein RJS97_09485 [Parvibaculaceae bacterium]